MKTKEYRNLLEAFWDQNQKRSSSPALVRKKNGKWETWSWSDTCAKTAQLAAALRKTGLAPGDRVAIFSDNCPEWVVTDFACMAGGFVSVPLYPSLTEEQVRYIVEHSGARVAIVRGIDRLKKLLPISRLEKIIVIDVTPQSDKTVAFGKFIEKESAGTATMALEARSLDISRLATIVYTSGTTADPKGVMLTHDNIFAQSSMLALRAAREPDDIILSYLPLSHITERANVFRQAVIGYPLYFSQGIDSVLQDVKEIRPTSFVAVPRIWEKLQEAACAQIAQAGPLHKKLFDKALEAGAEYLKERKDGAPHQKTLLRSRVYQKVAGPWVRAMLGFDRCRLFVSGAAPLDPQTLYFYFSFGMPMVEAYGMTECCGACHINHADRPVFGTVGPVLDGMECRIADDGEILMRGPNVFTGYYKDEEQTRETIKDGWLHSGDIGTIDENGCLKITDRKKNIIITSGGKNIAPAPLEFKIKRHKSISQVLVIGDRRKYLTALVTLAAAADESSARPAIQSHIDEVNAALPSYERIKAFQILPKDFSVEGGELTASLKVRRGFVQQKYAELIDSMYSPDQRFSMIVASWPELL